MIEVQVLSKVLNDNSLTLIRQNNLSEDHFLTYRNEFEFIMNHYSEYGNVPDKETFLAEFPDFDLIAVTESEKYLVETIHEQMMYAKMVPFVNKVAELVKEDSTQAVDFAKAELNAIATLTLSYKPGIDIIQSADDRQKEYKFRLDAKGLLGITSGIPELDEITHGWLKEDFITIVGRTNEGKTWVLLFFLVMAWKSGKRILLYSGEMSETLVGFRFDTLNANFSNEALMHGSEKLGDSTKADDYYNYLTNLSKSQYPFIVITPKHIGGNRLTIPALHNLIEMYKPDIVGIDQLSLMSDFRSKRGDQERTKYTHIAEDLYLTSEKYGIPVMSPAQANRDAAKKKEDDDTPEMHEVAESDGVPQNSTRQISIRKIGSTMKIAVKKNRYGKNNQELLLLWDIDKGIVKPFMQVSTDGNNKPVDTKSMISGEDLF